MIQALKQGCIEAGHKLIILLIKLFFLVIAAALAMGIWVGIGTIFFDFNSALESGWAIAAVAMLLGSLIILKS